MQNVSSDVFMSNRHFDFTGVKDLSIQINQLGEELQELDSLYSEVNDEYEASNKDNDLYLKLMRVSIMRNVLKEKYLLLEICLEGILEKRKQQIADTVVEISPEILNYFDSVDFNLADYLYSDNFLTLALRGNGTVVGLGYSFEPSDPNHSFPTLLMMEQRITDLKVEMDAVGKLNEDLWDKYNASNHDSELYIRATNVDLEYTDVKDEFKLIKMCYDGLVNERRKAIVSTILDIDDSLIEQMDSSDFNLFDYFCSDEYFDALEEYCKRK